MTLELGTNSLLLLLTYMAQYFREPAKTRDQHILAFAVSDWTLNLVSVRRQMPT